MHRDGIDDAELVARSRLGDEKAFEMLVRRYARVSFAVARAIVVNQADAEDVCQDAWLRALQRVEDCREPARFLSWFLQIVRNLARNRLQYNKVRAAEPLDAAASAATSYGPDDPTHCRRVAHAREKIEEAIARLPEDLREVLLLHDMAGWRHRLIADGLEISEVLSRQRLYQARVQLRRHLKELGPGGPDHVR